MIRRRPSPFPVLALALAMALPGELAARDSIAVFRDWGAFLDERPARCFAIAQPPPGAGPARGLAWASVATWPDRRIRAQLSAQLSRGHARGALVTLTIGDQAFPLIASDRIAWAHSRLQDAQVVAAMRSGSAMSIATVSSQGHAYADVYRLRGAASAIDAAMLACPLG